MREVPRSASFRNTGCRLARSPLPGCVTLPWFPLPYAAAPSPLYSPAGIVAALKGPRQIRSSGGWATQGDLAFSVNPRGERRPGSHPLVLPDFPRAGRRPRTYRLLGGRRKMSGLSLRRRAGCCAAPPPASVGGLSEDPHRTYKIAGNRPPGRR